MARSLATLVVLFEAHLSQLSSDFDEALKVIGGGSRKIDQQVAKLALSAGRIGGAVAVVVGAIAAASVVAVRHMESIG